MSQLVLCTLNMDEGDLEIRVSDVQAIERLPEKVKELIKDNFKGRKLSPLGLPEVLYLGANELKITSAFKYGDIAFMEVDGDLETFNEDSGVVCITAYKPDQSYEELEEGKDKYLEELKDKYPNGVTVE